MSNPAAKRLFKEYKSLSSDPPEGITAGPVTEDDMFLWEALIQGPEGTPFEGGVFPAELKFPKDYPLAPPKMKFLTDMWHPNGTCNQLHTQDLTKRGTRHKEMRACADNASVQQWRSMHIDPAPARRRPTPVRASVRAVVADSERGEDPHQRDEHAGRAERRESCKYRCSEDVEEQEGRVREGCTAECKEELGLVMD